MFGTGITVAEESVPSFVAGIFKKLETLDSKATPSFEEFHKLLDLPENILANAGPIDDWTYTYRIAHTIEMEASFFEVREDDPAVGAKPAWALSSVWFSKITNPEVNFPHWKTEPIFPRWFRGRGLVSNEAEYREWMETPTQRQPASTATSCRVAS